MFLINTVRKPSDLHGVGVFAAEAIMKGQVVYRHTRQLDLLFTEVELEELPKVERDYIRHHGYSDPTTGLWCLDHDDIRDMNFSDSPNVQRLISEEVIALRAITAGEEMTLENYRR